ncbi:MAG: hypothetical protein U0Y68_01905 [Blastocatellia bacterium]
MAAQKVAEPVELLSIMGLFSSYEEADEGYKYLTDLGYDQDHILVVLSESTQQGNVSGKTASHISRDAQHGPEPSAAGVEKSTKAVEGLGLGSSLGALAGAIAMIGTSIVLPGLGLAFLGPIAAGLVGASGGAALGGLGGLLYGSGVPEAEMPYYQNGIQAGKVLIGVRPRTVQDAEKISAKWEELGAELRPG